MNHQIHLRIKARALRRGKFNGYQKWYFIVLSVKISRGKKLLWIKDEHLERASFRFTTDLRQSYWPATP